MQKDCVIWDRQCIQCGECKYCDLEPEKTCDNCARCIETEADYRGIKIDDILLNIEFINKNKNNKK
ncbi:hypothetical protein DESME_07685 [Calderihabitans maritimus]|uniref:Uncharacterized protein n=1 Tax=Calderihabitans maritimus TaxID=1246530 RepID=A0A1Z5HQ91_9FIRM|nr:hypothetical protein DESME_07685 [Calderihabitans maritimus]